jgi:hypothetical protein
MTMKLELAPEVKAGLLAQAQDSGMSLEAFAELVLREKSREAFSAPREQSGFCSEPGEPFWKSFISQVHALPDAVFERLPTDGASEHDHYLYGAPREARELRLR